MVRRNKFPKVLNDLLAINDITQKALAEDIGVSNNTVCSWINKKSNPRASELITLADYFHVSVDYLLFDRN